MTEAQCEDAKTPLWIVAHEHFYFGQDFLQCYEQVEVRRQPGWPKYFLLTHAVELLVKAYLIYLGVCPRTLRGSSGHNLEKHIDRAAEMGLRLSGDGMDDLKALSKAHSKYWNRYPKLDGQPVVHFEASEKSVYDLYSFVQRVLFKHSVAD